MLSLLGRLLWLSYSLRPNLSTEDSSLPLTAPCVSKAKTEDILHIFCRCHYSAWVWQVCRLKLGLKRKSDFSLHLEAAQLGQV